MTSRAPTQCRACERWLRMEGKCAAFPEGIPSDIVRLGADHRVRFPGDGGIRFQQADNDEARQAFVDWQETFG